MANGASVPWAIELVAGVVTLVGGFILLSMLATIFWKLKRMGPLDEHNPTNEGFRTLAAFGAMVWVGAVAVALFIIAVLVLIFVGQMTLGVIGQPPTRRLF